MIDHFRLALYFKEKCLVRDSKDKAYLIGKPCDYGFNMAARHVEIDEQGNTVANDLYAPYDSLPSNFTGMAVKLFHAVEFGDPYVEIKASPAKLMQGHNVYGSDNIKDCAFEMLGLLFQSMPDLSPHLNLRLIEVLHIDVTYSSRVSSPDLVPKVIDYLSRISNNQTKPTKNKKYATTAYWGGENSRLLQLKCYGKHAELLVQLDEFKKKAQRGCKQSQMIVDTVYTPDLLQYSKTLLRWEARIKARKLERLGVPTNLIALINYQNENPNLLTYLWRNSFNPIFETLKGQAMPYADDNQIYEMLKEKLVTITAKGKKSYTRANNAMNFYHLVRDVGLEEVRKRYSSSTFYDNLKNLTDAGLQKAWLQNLHTENKQGQVIPLVRFCHVDFANQAPADYVPPVSNFTNLLKIA